MQAPANAQSFNRYSYAFNNPLSRVDSSGFVVEFLGSDEEKRRLAQIMDDQVKQNAEFAVYYKNASEAKNWGLRIGFTPTEAAADKATHNADVADSSKKSSVDAVDDAKSSTGSDGGRVTPRLTMGMIRRVTDTNFVEKPVDTSRIDTKSKKNPGQTKVQIVHPDIEKTKEDGWSVGFTLVQSISARSEARRNPEKLAKVLARENEHVTDNSILFNGVFKRESITTLKDNFFTAKELVNKIEILDDSYKKQSNSAASWWDVVQSQGLNYHSLNNNYDQVNIPTVEQIDHHRSPLR